MRSKCFFHFIYSHSTSNESSTSQKPTMHKQPAPPRFITDDNGVRRINPDYVTYRDKPDEWLRICAERDQLKQQQQQPPAISAPAADKKAASSRKRSDSSGSSAAGAKATAGLKYQKFDDENDGSKKKKSQSCPCVIQ